MHAGHVFSLALALSVPLGAQPAPPSGTVEGIVVNSVTGAPVRKALVVLRDVDRYRGEQAISDTAGRFRLQVTPGSYIAWAEAQGYERAAPDYNRIAARGRVVAVEAGGTMKNLSIALQPSGVIAGRVLNQDGAPVAGTTVQLLRYIYSETGVRMEPLRSVTADDRGEYRIPDVTAGRWYLSAYRYTPPPEASGRVHSTVAERGYGTVFHPGVERAAEAAGIDVAAGVEVVQDLRLNRVRLFHIRGRVAGEVPVDTYVMADTCVTGMPPKHSVRIRPGGLFDFWGMTPGPYCLSVRTPAATGGLHAAEQVVLTDRDVNGVTLTPGPGLTLRGSVSLEGGDPSRLGRMRVDVIPMGGGEVSAGDLDERGAFAIEGLHSGAYRLGTVRMPAGMYLKSIRHGPADRTADARIEVQPGAPPLELVVASATGVVSGTVAGKGTGLEPVALTLAPAAPLSDRPDRVITLDARDLDGAFRFEKVPPGRYLLFAWELNDLLLAAAPQFRALLESRATTVEVDDGATQTANPALISSNEIAEARRRLR